MRGERRETGNAVANWEDHHSLDLFFFFYNLKNKRSLSSKNKFRNLKTIWLFLASFVVTEETSDKPSWLVGVGLLRQHQFSIKGEFCDMMSKEWWKCLHLLTHFITINILFSVKFFDMLEHLCLIGDRRERGERMSQCSWSICVIGVIFFHNLFRN